MNVVLQQIFQRGRGTARILQPRPPAPFEQSGPGLPVEAPDAYEQVNERDAATPAPQDAPVSEEALAQSPHADPQTPTTLPSERVYGPPQILAETAAPLPFTRAQPAASKIQPLASGKPGLAAVTSPLSAQSAVQRRSTDPAIAPAAPPSLDPVMDQMTSPSERSEPASTEAVSLSGLTSRDASDTRSIPTSTPTSAAIEIGDVAVLPTPVAARSTAVHQPPNGTANSRTDSANPADDHAPSSAAYTRPVLAAAAAHPSRDTVRHTTPVAAPAAKGSGRRERTAQSSATPANSPPKVEIRIGRIDVQTPPAAPAAAPALANSGAVGMSLDAFLAEGRG